jgi:hypothetical protein
MPSVAIKTGLIDPEGREVVLQEYLCDWPQGCANIAEEVVGVACEIALTCVLCREHASRLGRRRPDDPAEADA